ncbi:hypothetical protein SEA_CECE_216 [Microbacterium phage Cece]|nr:hypothetical protein SEA_CECE_216 [Microbacterium phage Cece]
MQVSRREEALAKELYEHDMGIHQAEDMPWEQQIDRVTTMYRRLASTIVNSRWFKKELDSSFYRGKNSR